MLTYSIVVKRSTASIHEYTELPQHYYATLGGSRQEGNFLVDNSNMTKEITTYTVPVCVLKP